MKRITATKNQKPTTADGDIEEYLRSLRAYFKARGLDLMTFEEVKKYGRGGKEFKRPAPQTPNRQPEQS